MAILAGCGELAGLDDFSRRDSSSGAGAEGAGAAGGGGATSGGGGGAAPSCGDDLRIRELRTRGSNGATDDFVEIYNPTSNAVDLSDYRVSARSPGGGEDDRFSGRGVLPAYTHLLIAGMGFDDQASVDEALPQNRSFGDDVIVYLKRSGSVIDVLCVCAAECATPGWNDCGGVLLQNPAAAAPNVDLSIERRDKCVDTGAISDFAEGPSTPAGKADGADPP